ncbi:ECF RNA polymerase sigma factor SigD [mine drainage metagenome]|jgi:RNA polymerase sigma-70 factor (ECF subfamily)|uniref:ECF RNA polymerase sigma factor SigD n=1 Tax=mine drainage metagenome TaxID=410659 RepID=A0A1J5RJ85_9ZZZZ
MNPYAASLGVTSFVSMSAEPALERFCADVRSRALRLALLETGGHAAAASDLVQDALTRLVARYRERPAEQWPPLFYGILRNRIVDWHRKRRVERVFDFFFSDDDDGAPAWESLVDPADGPEAQVSSLQQAARVAAALQRLSARQRQVFVLREVEELSIVDTAQAMGISESSVKTHHLRALTRLRGWLDEEG